MRVKSPPSPIDASASSIAPSTPAFVPDGAGSSTASPTAESGRDRFHRRAHRARLHLYAWLAIVLLVGLVALAVANTSMTRVSWVFGTSRVALVWLILCSAILGWLLGIVVTAAFHRRTRTPRS